MGTIAAHEFIAVDGVFEDLSWTFDYGFDPKMGEALAQITGRSTAILLGRTTYEMFAPAWRDRTVEDDPGAPFFNDTTKYVVGSTELTQEWGNTERLGPYDPAAIRTLKDQIDGTIYVSGSGQLVRGLLQDGLLDELHLFVYPIALGKGERLFSVTEPTRLTLTDQETYENGVLHLGYGPA
ncbi:dihydrofolate reductase family protein [Luteipulveratus flavus]|uniref:Dihydrofolate reductase family protein n=1 Tax=Luteipulveratus flavus TaxID=3031728 RepID=A0ABT6C9S3_9MICO|nr:dihydrofolate reductase family protein [Luteipulveratus sp. YIM 133296]MDF8265657.1 dihydrofolate reductase family protein [Luteipulveratus sp. YIM 133296]